MKRILFIGLISILSSNACHHGNDVSNDPQSQKSLAQDELEITNLIRDYAESINNADAVMGSSLFAHTAEVTFIHPRGHEKGWEQINSSIYKFFGDTFSNRDLKTLNEKVTIYNNTAWAEFYWIFDATFNSDSTPLQTRGRETQIWRKSDGQWQIVHIHYSGMPVTVEREGS